MAVAVVAVLRTRWTLRAERRRRNAAEEAARHADRLADLAGAFARVRRSDEALDVALHEALHALRGDAGAVGTLQDGIPTLTRSAGYEDRLKSAGELFPAEHTTDAVNGRHPLVIESAGAPIAFVPIIARRDVAAIVRIDFSHRRTLTEGDHALLVAVAGHAGRALERTSGQEADHRARVEAETLRARADQELVRRQQTELALRASETRYRALATRTTRLHTMTARLSEAVNTQAVAAAIVEHATVVVGASAGDVLMLDEAQTQFHVLTCADGDGHQPDADPADCLEIEPGLYEVEAVTTHAPVFVSSWAEAQERFWRSASRAADGGFESSAALPLVIDGAVVGVLRFDFSVPVNFDDEYRTLLVSVAQHCTQALDRARLYESAQRARSEAEAASRLKDEFLSIVSHELRTPLNAVLGWSAMLQKTGLDAALGQRAARSIQDNATRQAKLIDDLLDVSRIAAGIATLDRQDVQSGEVVGAVVESLTPVAASNGVELHFSCVESAVVRGDRRRLEQVLFNIIGNALKFTPRDGRVDVTTRVIDGAADITITDSGIGIDPAFLPHVFDRFRQADSTSTRAYGGLGLGLAIARQLVDAHGGSITASSAGSGEGASFHVRLPLASGETRAARAEQPAAPAQKEPVVWTRLDDVRVLAVDDEPATLELMAFALKHCGADVTTAASAPEAYERLRGSRYDVLLADIAMPGEDGCSLIRRIRASGEPRLAALPAAAVTAHAGADERREILQAGFDLHLVKPIAPDELARAVKQLVARTAIA
ncbi:MAG TPA: ATP-binding protein [Vicinamibacterales bacterium]|nr:ATP-binding protein [Vicinamibacterales bacterium]